jgi:hypothetical protein
MSESSIGWGFVCTNGATVVSKHCTSGTSATGNCKSGWAPVGGEDLPFTIE